MTAHNLTYEELYSRPTGVEYFMIKWGKAAPGEEPEEDEEEGIDSDAEDVDWDEERKIGEGENSDDEEEKQDW